MTVKAAENTGEAMRNQCSRVIVTNRHNTTVEPGGQKEEVRTRETTGVQVVQGALTESQERLLPFEEVE